MYFIRINNSANGVEILSFIDAACFNSPWSVAQWRDEIENRENSVLLISEDEELLFPVGFISYGISGDDLELKKIAVLPPFRRKQIAGLAIEKMLDDARILDKHNILVEVAATNLSAIRLYEKHGFYKISVRRKYYDKLVDAIVMQKEV
jgi:ribosomal-protein-alanine N-acetyltransferase